MIIHIQSQGKLTVSVCVITFNHELYIKKCLDSILSQKCNFNFEIVIRDDCSKDKTAEIIKEYHQKYPNIIKLLDGKINIGVAENVLKVYAAVKGKYIAPCEGDDYWIDNFKLQKQVDLMEADQEITFCAHPCKIHDKNGLSSKVFFVKSSYMISIDCDSVLREPGQYAPTASYMFRQDILKLLPDWFKSAPVGDFFVEMYALAAGKGFYLTEPMSAYRTFSLDSWSSLNVGHNAFARLKNANAMLFYLNKMRNESIFQKFDFSPKVSTVLFDIATACLMLKDYHGFRDAIVRCKKEKGKLEIKKLIFYYTRFTPKLAGFIYNIKLQFFR